MNKNTRLKKSKAQPRNKTFQLSFLTVGLMIALNTTHAATTTLISVNGSIYTDKSSNNPSLNYDGSKIVFVSQSGKLVGDTNSQSNVYLKNRNTNTLKRISLSKNSTTQAANKASYGPDISADGNKIVFYSLATDIVSSDTNGKTDVFLHDLTTGKSQLVSVTQSGVQGNAESTEAQISDDGNFVAFSSASTTLTGINTNNKRHIYVKNLSTQSLEIVSVNNAGEAGDQDSFSPSISGDGRYITFVSIANNFDSHSASGQYDIYLHDRQNGVTERISFGDTGVVSNSHSSLPSISADGRYISYMSLASNLASNDTDNTMDIFVYDRETGNVEKATTTATTSGPSYSPKISSNGRFVAFYSSAFNLVSEDNNGRDDFFVYDRYLKTTELLSISATGAQTSKNVDSVVAISGDGKITAFASADDTLVSGDSNRTSDVFVRVRDNIANLKPFAKSTPVASQECNNGGAYITLDASGSYDLDKDALTINWSGPFGNVSGAIVSVFVGYGSHAVTLTVTDSAGNKDQKTISLNVVDTISPTITAENDLTLEATHVNGAQHNVNFTANDNCGIVNTIVSPSPLYYSLGVNNVTVSAVDNAGHTASDVTKVTVVDTTAPALSIPSDLTKEATGRQTAISVGNAKATDIFPVTITNDSTGTFSLGQTTIKWTATDSNGNSISRNQKITVKDTTSPVLNIPADITSEATNVLSTLNIGAATATDIFNVAVSNNAPLMYPMGNTNVTWTAKDENNNSTTAIQKISIIDTTPPELSVPDNIRQQATDVLTPVTLGEPVANDIFSVTISNDGLAAYPLGDTIVNWNVTDANGNAVTAQQSVTIFDNIAPELILPENVIMEATDVLSPLTLNTAQTTDIFSVDLSNDAPATFPLGTTAVVWRATDTSGNTTESTQTVLVKDTTPPVIDPVSNIVKEATDILTPVDIGTVTARDIFDITTINNSPGKFPLGDTLVTWTVSDSSSNVTKTDQKVTITDTTAPLLETPADITTEAVNTLTPVSIGNAKASDIFSVSLTNDAPAQFPLGKTIVNWTALDANNNSTSKIQNISIVDTTPPVINAGSDVTLEATSVNGASFTPKYSASDICNCGEITINISPLASSYSLGNHTISVTATDISANAATDQMVLSVVDTTAPVLNIPASITMEASGGLTPVFVGDATATDIFPVTVVNDSPQVFPLGTSNVVWTATDANGNTTTAMQSVTIIDSTAPTFELNVINPTINRPNHKMKHVATVNGVQDLVDSAPVVDITVSSNGEHPHKHKHDHEDWKIEEVDGEWLIWVRAEKLKRNKEDRVYHIDVSVSDFTGNTAQQSTDITVLRNHSHSGKHDEHKQKKSDKKHSESNQHQEKQKDLDGRKHDRHQTQNQKREHNRKKHD